MAAAATLWAVAAAVSALDVLFIILEFKYAGTKNCSEKKCKIHGKTSVIDYKQPSKPWTPLLRNKQTSIWGAQSRLY